MRSILVTKSTDANYQNTNGSPTKRWHILAGSYRNMKHLGSKNWGTNKLACVVKNTTSILLTTQIQMVPLPKDDTSWQVATERWNILAA